MDKKRSVIVCRVAAIASILFALAAAIVSFVSGKNTITKIVFSLLILGLDLPYAIYLLVKGNRSPRTLLGYSITYHIVSIAVEFAGYVVLLVSGFLGAIINHANSSSSSVSSAASISSSSGGTVSSTNVAWTFFMLYLIFAIVFALFGIVKIVMCYQYMKDHQKYHKAYLACASIYWGLLVLIVIFIFVALALLTFLSFGLLVAATGLTFLCLFISADSIFLSTDEMNVTMENGVTPKQ